MAGPNLDSARSQSLKLALLVHSYGPVTMVASNSSKQLLRSFDLVTANRRQATNQSFIHGALTVSAVRHLLRVFFGCFFCLLPHLYGIRCEKTT